VAKNVLSLLKSLESPQSSSTPTLLPSDQTPNDIKAYRESEDGKALVAWVKQEYNRAKGERSRQQSQWYVNMSMFYGQHWVERTSKLTPGGYDNKLFTPRVPNYRHRRTINRTRSFVRHELSKFIGQAPSAIVVPSTGEDDDLRAAYAGEQAWESISSSQKLDYHFGRAMWWTIITGNGFIKTWWDQSCQYAPGQQGNIRYGAVTPFHFFVPDLREHDIEDQPFVINAYTKPLEWCNQFFADELKGVNLKASVASANQILESGHLNLGANNPPDSCIIYEAWLKPGAHKLFPNGAVVIMVDDILINITPDGLPYEHGQFPFAKFEHIPTATFYGDSPIVDIIPLQKEYNQLRTEIGVAGQRMAKPQLAAQQGSIIASKVTNEPGQIIFYRPGTAAPTPIPLQPLPQYYVDQQDRMLSDWEELTGVHDVSKGAAPNGVTAGTAINYLQERDDSFLATEYKSVENGYEKIASQTLGLFVQYVDTPRQIKVVGADDSFDMLMLSGTDLRNATDIRMEKGSSIAQSQAGKQAQVENMFAVGMIDQPTALRLMEMGGVNKVLDTLKVAERKAQRENLKMKRLQQAEIDQHQQIFDVAQAQQQAIQLAQAQQQMLNPPALPVGSSDPTAVPADPSLGAPAPTPTPGTVAPDPTQPDPSNPATADPTQWYPDDPSAIPPMNVMSAPGAPTGPGPVIPVDDFDVHQVHIETHNKFRMTAEYEMLPVEIKNQFELHVKQHEQAMMQKTLQSFFSQIPSDGTDGSDSGSMDVPIGGQADTSSQPGAGPTMSANGAVPDASTQSGGPNAGATGQ